MTASLHPDLEQLFDELIAGEGPALDHARECSECSAVLEEHRQLEKDLFRLADPLPPPELVSQVMAKVAAAPAPARFDAKTGFGILISAVVLAIGAFVITGGGVGRLGVGLAGAAVWVRDFGIAFVHALNALFRTAAVPTALTLSALLLLSLYGLRRLTDLSLHEQKVLS